MMPRLTAAQRRERVTTTRVSQAAVGMVVVWFAVFLVTPLGVLVTQNIEWADIQRVLSDASTWRVVWFSLWQSMLSVAATFVIAAPVTWLVGRYEFRGRRPLRALTTVGFLLPSVVVGAAFLAMLPRSMHSSIVAVVLAHAYFNVAVVVRVVGSRLETLDIRLVEVARVLGASSPVAMGTIVWPLCRRAVGSAAIVIFLYCFTSFAVVRVLGGPTRNTIESDIALRAFGIGDISGATVLAFLQVALIVAVVSIVQRAAGREPSHLRAAAPSPEALPQRVRGLALLVVTITSALIAMPLLAVFWRSARVGDEFSLEGWRAVLTTSLFNSVMASLRTAILTGVLGVLLAAATAFVVVRMRGLGRVLDSASVIPLAVSPVTLGLGLVVTFDESWYDWRAAWWFVAVAHTMSAVPLLVRVLVPAWRSIPSRLHEAATVLGAGEFRRLIDVDVRYLKRTFVAGLGLAVAVSLGEFGAASILSRRGTETMPVAVARLLERTGDLIRAQAFALASLLIVFCVGALLVVESATAGRRHAGNR